MKRIKTYFSICLLWAFFWLSVLNGYAQTLPFGHLLNEDGLENSNIHCLLQDNSGFLWFGTENGLHLFDGISFTLFEHDPNDSTSLSGNVIFKLIEDVDGNLWVCTNNGLDRFDRLSNKFHHIDAKVKQGANEEYLAKFYVPTALYTTQHELYVSLGEYGIFIYNKAKNLLEQPDWISQLTSTEFGVINSICQQNEQLIWMGTQNNGLFRFDIKNKQITPFLHTTSPSSISSNVIYTVFYDHLNRLWVGTGRGLNLYQPITNTFVVVNPDPQQKIGIENEKIYTISGDNEGNVWFGSDGKGIYMLAPNGKFVHYEKEFLNPNSLYSNFIRGIYKDWQGNIWVATREGGINFVLNNNALVFQNVGEKNPLNSGFSYRSVTTICHAGGSKYLIGTDGGGLDLYDVQSNQIETMKYTTVKSVLTVYSDDEYLMYGGYLEGFTVVNKKTKEINSYRRIETDPKSLPHNDVRHIVRDSYGQFWIATNGGGIALFNPKTKEFKHIKKIVNNPNSLISDYCMSIFEDRNKNLWIGTYNGFAIMDRQSETFRNYFNIKNQNSLSGDWVYTFCEDSKGRMWIGTNFGLNLFDVENGNFTIFSKNEGLPGNEIMGIIEDDNQKLWISTNNGICQYDIDNKKFMLFDYTDGLINNQFNHGAYLKHQNILFFGGSNGLTFFDPKKIKQNATKPPVYITNIETTGKQHVFSIHDQTENGVVYSKITVPFKESSSINIKFTALNYINSKKNNFRYKLDGFDRDWVDVGNHRSVNYTNLKPGSYTFSVIASNNNNVWNDKGASIEFVIKPPFYLSTYALIFYLLVSAVGVAFFYRYTLIRLRFKRDLAMEQVRREKTEEIARMKTDFFVNISHELSTPLTLILVPLQRIFDTAKFDAHLVQTALNNSKRLLKLVNELLDFQKIEEERTQLVMSKQSIDRFVSDIVENFKEIFHNKNIQLKFSSSLENQLTYFDTDKMEKIMYNLISNALKYTQRDGMVNVDLEIVGGTNQVKIMVSDNGIGIPKEKIPYIFDKYYRVKKLNHQHNFVEATGYGIGLYMTKKLVEMHKGYISIDSEENKGSVFTVMIPLFEKSDIEQFGFEVRNTEIALDYNEPEIDTPDEEEEVTKQNLKKDHRPLVLIVEDNKELNVVLQQQLSENYRVMDAYDGLEGLKMAKRYLPDLVITDVMMPGIDGVELCEKIKSDVYTSHIPVIILTALNTNEYRLKGYVTGADDYITKPFNTKILETRVVNLIESRKNLQKKFVRDVQVNPGEITVTSSDEKFVEQSIKVIEQNIENPEFSVGDLAKAMNMSDATFYRKVKAITSQSPNIFIRTIRLKRAAQLLLTTNYSVTEVVYMVGLNDVKYFRKCFQSQFGMNPLEYIKQEE